MIPLPAQPWTQLPGGFALRPFLMTFAAVLLTFSTACSDREPDRSADPSTQLAPGPSQDVRQLPERRDLRGIRMDRVAVLGDEDQATVGPNFAFEVAPDGRFLISSFARRREVLVFDTDGRFEGAFGGRGEGPGEYRFVRHIHTGDRLVHIFDTGNKRWTVLDPGDWSVVDTRSFSGDPHDVLVAGDSIAFLSAMIPTSEGVGLPIHRLGTDGDIDSSFGADADGPIRTDQSILTRRILQRGEDDLIWVAHSSQYRVERWSMSGEMWGGFEREVAWFEPHAGSPLPDPESPPASTVTDLEFDPDLGLMWVAISIPDPEWYEGVVKSQYAEGSGYQVGDWDRYFDTMVEAIDVSSGEVVGHLQVDEFIWSFGKGGYAASYFEAEGSLPKIAVWRLSLSPGGD